MHGTAIAKGMTTKPAKALQETVDGIAGKRTGKKFWFTKHFGRPVIVEREPIEVAKVQISGDQLHQSVLIHPRYVPANTPHEKIKVWGFRRGRTLDIMLEEPVQIDGENFGVLNFKGVGADADRDLVISPSKWWANDAWGRRQLDGRRFGAVNAREAAAEVSNNLFYTHGMLQVPHIGMNLIPPPMQLRVSAVEKDHDAAWGNADSRIAQLVRAVQTNIRMDDCYQFSLVDDLIRPFIDIQKLASEDSKSIALQGKLWKEKEAIIEMDGEVAGNRYVDSRFTDMENYELRPNASEIYVFPTRVIMDSARFLRDNRIVEYFGHLEEKSGLGFKKILKNMSSMYIYIANTVQDLYLPLKKNADGKK